MRALLDEAERDPRLADMLQRAVAFADPGAGYLDRVDKHRTARRLVRRLDALGYDVMLRSKAAA